jgi:hypothetical protein
MARFRRLSISINGAANDSFVIAASSVVENINVIDEDNLACCFSDDKLNAETLRMSNSADRHRSHRSIVLRFMMLRILFPNKGGGIVGGYHD